MRYIGIILIAVGIALFLFIGFNYLKEKNKVISPVPDEKGVKVIFVTPAE